MRVDLQHTNQLGLWQQLRFEACCQATSFSPAAALRTDAIQSPWLVCKPCNLRNWSSRSLHLYHIGPIAPQRLCGCVVMADELTNEQIEEFKDAFALFDKDGDGTVTEVELDRVMQGLGQNLTGEEIRGMINEVDNDGNGSIDFEEFLHMVASKIAMEGCCMRDELKDAFKVFDRNGDGHVTAQELREVLENTGEYMKREDIDELIATADCNGDGRIDYEEFASIMVGL